MTNKHTQGPWSFDPEDNSIVGKDEELSIATIDNIDVGGGKGFHFGTESEANARLIAAAPTMLDALIAADLAMAQGGILSCHATRKEIHAAIAMATGEQQ